MAGHNSHKLCGKAGSSRGFEINAPCQEGGHFGMSSLPLFLAATFLFPSFFLSLLHIQFWRFPLYVFKVPTFVVVILMTYQSFSFSFW